MSTVHRGKYVTPSAGAQVITGAGDLVAVLMAHDSTGSQEATFYDDTSAQAGSELLHIELHQYRSPIYLRFPRDEAIPFSTGLYVVNANAELALWIVEH
jgi:hypothetical protein